MLSIYFCSLTARGISIPSQLISFEYFDIYVHSTDTITILLLPQAMAVRFEPPYHSSVAREGRKPISTAIPVLAIKLDNGKMAISVNLPKAGDRNCDDLRAA